MESRAHLRAPFSRLSRPVDLHAWIPRIPIAEKAGMEYPVAIRRRSEEPRPGIWENAKRITWRQRGIAIRDVLITTCRAFPSWTGCPRKLDRESVTCYPWARGDCFRPRAPIPGAEDSLRRARHLS